MKTEIITLEIEAKGEVVTSNFPAFAEMVRARLGEINRELCTDDDFDQADADAKAIAGAEAALKAAKEKALADAEQLHALFEGIDSLSAEMAAARLDLQKQITKRKEEAKDAILEEFLGLYDIDPRDARLHFLGGLRGSVKGKRTLDSMRTACRVYQSSTAATIHKARAILDRFEATHGPELIMDRRNLELTGPDAVEAELRRRWEAKKAAEALAKAKAETAAAQAAVQAAQKPAESAPQQLTPEPAAKPENPPQTESPAIIDGKSELVELNGFKADLMDAFRPLKAARASLRHPANIAKARDFADALNRKFAEVFA
jgi:multidrug resistance efflux pump